jgi:hypothetical protein
MRVYDASSSALLATFQPGGAGLLNDVAVTREAVYVTDSTSPWGWPAVSCAET